VVERWLVQEKRQQESALFLITLDFSFINQNNSCLFNVWSLLLFRKICLEAVTIEKIIMKDFGLRKVLEVR